VVNNTLITAGIKLSLLLLRPTKKISLEFKLNLSGEKANLNLNVAETKINKDKLNLYNSTTMRF
jgi:hypothetical protein